MILAIMRIMVGDDRRLRLSYEYGNTGSSPNLAGWTFSGYLRKLRNVCLARGSKLLKVGELVGDSEPTFKGLRKLHPHGGDVAP
ncbi:MAG TPA: hypothetical protein VEH56_03705 [Candidatus Saccharimonadales bacterium]|nr:hypothetical protein [Candidatus Saccharimonadales bacterium]